MTDKVAQDAGSVMSWSITFGTNAPVPPPPVVSDLPLFVITTTGGIVDDPKVAANLRIIDNASGINTATDSAAFNSLIGIEIRGNYSASLPQKPYSFEH